MWPTCKLKPLAGGRSRFVGMLVPGLDTGYVGEIARSVDTALAEAGYALMLFSTKGREEAYFEAITNGLTAGILLVVPLVPKAYEAALQQHQFPIVMIDQSTTMVNGSIVETTNWQGTYSATEYLVELGHERIAYITGLLTLQSASDRLDGYKTALQHSNIDVDESLIVEGDYLRESGYKAAMSLLKQENRPTAISCIKRLHCARTTWKLHMTLV